MEIVVSDDSFAYAPGLLCASGLFSPAFPQEMDMFDGGWRYQCEFPYLAPGAWAGEASKSMVVILPAERAGIDPDSGPRLKSFFAQRQWDTRCLCPAPRLDLDSLTDEDTAFLPLPHLASLMWSLFHRDRELEKMDDGRSALGTATRCLVDGMDLTTEWAYKHFEVSDAGYAKLIRHLVITKGDRHGMIDPRTWTARGSLDPKIASLIRSHPGRD